MKPRKRIPSVGKRRSKELTLYAKLRKAYLETHPICEMWLYENQLACLHHGGIPDTAPRSIEIHHRMGKTGWLLNHVPMWMAVCRESHNKIEREREWAYAKGYLIGRSSKNVSEAKEYYEKTTTQTDPDAQD